MRDAAKTPDELRERLRREREEDLFPGSEAARRQEHARQTQQPESPQPEPPQPQPKPPQPQPEPPQPQPEPPQPHPEPPQPQPEPPPEPPPQQQLTPKRNKGGQPRKLDETQVEAGIQYLRDHPELTLKEAFPKVQALIPNLKEGTFRRRIWDQRNRAN
jgi:hypothetical protein